MTRGRVGLLSAVKLLAALLCVCAMPGALAQYTAPYVAVIGTMSSANGMPASNYSLSFQPTQVMFVGGTSIVVANSNCATDANGAVVGIRNPLQGPVVNANLSTGTVPAGNYYVEITWYDTYTHQTLPSPEIQVQLSTTGSIVVSPPASGAAINTIGMNVYIGSTSGGETYQGQTTSSTATYTQSVPLTTGAAVPILNGTVCQVVANDAAWPIAGYNATLANASGNTVPGFPQQWQFVGPGSTYNLSNGLPLYNGRVTYPVPVLTLPYNHNAQSISGSLSLSSYNLFNVGAIGVGTSNPAWGVDVEGTGTKGLINSIGGYLIDGAGGADGQAPCSDGTAIDTFCTFVTSLPTVYYQTVDAAGTAQTQRAALNFLAPFTVADSSSPARTNIGLPTVGTGGFVPMAAGLGTASDCAIWTAAGLGDSGSTCGTTGFTNGNNANGYWEKDPLGHITQWGNNITLTCSSSPDPTITFPIAFTDISSVNVLPISGVPAAGAGASGQIALSYSAVTLTNFQVHQQTNACLVLYWHADGY